MSTRGTGKIYGETTAGTHRHQHVNTRCRYASKVAVKQHLRAEENLVNAHPRLEEVLSTIRFLKNEMAYNETHNTSSVFLRASAFVAGFTLMFYCGLFNNNVRRRWWPGSSPTCVHRALRAQPLLYLRLIDLR